MKFLYQPNKYFPTGDWGSGFLSNDPLLREKIIYARDLREKNAALASCFPDRHLYLYYGTVEKGILYPLVFQKGQLIPLSPMPSPRGDKKFTLINDPLDFFSPYSQEFRSFLQHLFSSLPPASIDVSLFLKIGDRSREEGRFQEAIWGY